MILKTFSYEEYENSPRFWKLEEFKLNSINLIVGNNTSGKSRTLNVIHGLSKLLLSPRIQFNSGTYNGMFETNQTEYSYSVKFEDGKVMFEKMLEKDRILFERNESGTGKIFNSDLKQLMNFKIPQNELVAYRRDEIQFPYLENLFNWASNTRHFRFSKEQEKHTLALIDSNKTPTESFNMKGSNQAIEVFRRAKARYRDTFINNLIIDFNSIGYNINDIDVGVLHSIKVDAPGGNKVVGLRVKENDRNGLTDQNEMSDGMFRALSVLIHYNYYILEKKNLNILIDDIGEGLDFERSSKLIQLLINKSQTNNIQLSMSTNDKFVMNHTSLEYWQIISREGANVKMFNKYNSNKEFEDFRFTGLNNFDFFSTDFFKTGME
ncbi:ATP-binding protein [Gramella lutea]|uniref:ATP-binding protein n=1 Tax=Christiangramia lutea TaxID=1607951 RepID=A0A9X1V8Z9_9FLAO|nr:ATP-binding protein [Christiangramia lutea]MCH4824588.1 ATP-binding protein [Christiangramia lutea]